MTCVVFPDRATCPGVAATRLAETAWLGITGAFGATAVCSHTPTASAWQPNQNLGMFTRTLSCDECNLTSSVTTPEDHRGCQ